MSHPRKELSGPTGDRSSTGSAHALSRRALLQSAGLFGLAVLAPAVLIGCHASKADDPTGELSRLLATRWQERYPGKSGGLTLQVLTPGGDWFASTLAGTTAGHHFRGASLTKTFTSAAIMLLDQRGLLRIDDLVGAVMPGRTSTYLPDTPAYAIANRNLITIRHLLQHRAGVFDLANQVVPLEASAPYAGRRYPDWRTEQDPLHTFTPDELAGVLATLQLSNFLPGTQYRYSDSGFMLLSKIVEQASGLPLETFKAQELLQPNGLTQTHFVTDGTEWVLPAPFISGYTLAGGAALPSTEYNYSYDPGSGNLITTPRDLAHWVRRLVRGEAGVSAAQITRMSVTSSPENYGLGLMRLVVSGQDLGLGHTGGTSGYVTLAFHDPKTDVTLLLQCSLVDAEDMLGQFQWATGIMTDVLKVLGF